MESFDRVSRQLMLLARTDAHQCASHAEWLGARLQSAQRPRLRGLSPSEADRQRESIADVMLQLYTSLSAAPSPSQHASSGDAATTPTSALARPLFCQMAHQIVRLCSQTIDYSTCE